ncbi:beta-xylosidase [Paenibacillus sp. DS2015]|uniref:lipocalin-like domain-containing protein n=1 Tax=Paenibacillus sp. DS2015 TaxID=3373917 RepID=UPI003D1D4646
MNNKGEISGEASGTRTLMGDQSVELTLDGVVYYGVFLREWELTSAAEVLTFSALSDEGVAVWGSRLAD